MKPLKGHEQAVEFHRVSPKLNVDFTRPAATALQFSLNLLGNQSIKTFILSNDDDFWLAEMVLKIIGCDSLCDWYRFFGQKIIDIPVDHLSFD